jgi:hypothetical protein
MVEQIRVKAQLETDGPSVLTAPGVHTFKIILS